MTVSGPSIGFSTSESASVKFVRKYLSTRQDIEQDNLMKPSFHQSEALCFGNRPVCVIREVRGVLADLRAHFELILKRKERVSCRNFVSASLCRSSSCSAGHPCCVSLAPGPAGRGLSPVEFEAHAGRLHHKKWRQSLWVRLPAAGGPRETTVEQCRALQGGKHLVSVPTAPDAPPVKTSSQAPGRRQHSGDFAVRMARRQAVDKILRTEAFFSCRGELRLRRGLLSRALEVLEHSWLY